MENGYIKLASHEVAPYNDSFVEMIRNGQEKEASVALDAYTRDELRESSFTEKILTPFDIENSDLDKGEDPEMHVKWSDREPDAAPAITVPLGTVFDAYQFVGKRYPNYFSRILGGLYNKDVSLLGGYDYDIRKVMMEIDTKNIATEVDTRFIETVNASIGTVNTANPLNGRGLPQNVTIAGGITRDNLIEAFKVIQRLRVPFGPMLPDGGESKGCLLANVTTAMDLLGFSRNEAGGDESQRAFVEGTHADVLGVKLITTIKDELVPDGAVYAFSSEEYMGKYLRLQPLTTFVRNEAYFIQFGQYMNISLSIGNVKSMVKVQF